MSTLGVYPGASVGPPVARRPGEIGRPALTPMVRSARQNSAKGKRVGQTKLERAIVLAVAVLLILPPTTSATHTVACSESSGHNRFSAAWKVPAAAPTGVRGTTEGQALDVCTSGTDDDRANLIWVSIDPNNGDANAVIQAGRGNCKSPSADANDCFLRQMRWWAWGRTQGQSGCGTGVNTVAPHVIEISTWSSGTDGFIVARNGTNWQVFVDGFLEDFVSQASICWTKARATWTGESWDAGDAIGGSAGNNFAMTGAAYQTSVGGGWLSPGFVSGANCNLRSAKYECVTPSSTSVIYWTTQ